ncbi:MAG: FGGY-family carbohydrate kinase, partial [Planctomycetota bacterium]
MSWMGVDIGTSGCKAVVFDDAGRRLEQEYRGYELHRPEAGAAELDPLELRAAWRAVIATAAAAVADTDPVAGIGISSQGEAVLALDAADEPVAPVLTSLDARPAVALARIVAAQGAERIYTSTGHTPHPMFSLGKVLWMQEERPADWRRCRRLHCLEDALQRDLGVAEPAMSWSLAGRTLLFAVQAHAWDEELCAAAGVPSSSLPRTAASGSVAGHTGGACGERFGLPAGIPVVCGGHDQGMAALGAGVARPGEAMFATGTVACICPAVERLRFSPALQQANLCSYDFTIPGLATTVAFNLTGGNLLQWFRDTLAPELVFEALLASMPTAPTDLLSLPYFAPSGTPYFDPQPKGAVLGLALTDTRGSLLKGLLEGSVMEMRLNLQILAENGIPVDSLRATGGAARSRLYTQLAADVLGRPIAALDVEEAGCLGGAMLAAAGARAEPTPLVEEEDAF